MFYQIYGTFHLAVTVFVYKASLPGEKISGELDMMAAVSETGLLLLLSGVQ